MLSNPRETGRYVICEADIIRSAYIVYLRVNIMKKSTCCHKCFLMVEHIGVEPVTS